LKDIRVGEARIFRLFTTGSEVCCGAGGPSRRRQIRSCQCALLLLLLLLLLFITARCTDSFDHLKLITDVLITLTVSGKRCWNTPRLNIIIIFVYVIKRSLRILK